MNKMYGRVEKDSVGELKCGARGLGGGVPKRCCFSATACPCSVRGWEEPSIFPHTSAVIDMKEKVTQDFSLKY